MGEAGLGVARGGCRRRRGTVNTATHAWEREKKSAANFKNAWPDRVREKKRKRGKNRV